MPILFRLHSLSLSPLFFFYFLSFPLLLSFFPLCVPLPFAALPPDLTFLFTPSLHPIPLSHFLSHHARFQALWSCSILLGCCILRQARRLLRKVDQQKMPAISVLQQFIYGFQLYQTVTGSIVLEMLTVAALVGYGPTHLLSLSEVSWAIDPPVLRKMSLIYFTVN